MSLPDSVITTTYVGNHVHSDVMLWEWSSGPFPTETSAPQWHVGGGPGVTWSHLWRNTPVKQTPKVEEWYAGSQVLWDNFVLQKSDYHRQFNTQWLNTVTMQQSWTNGPMSPSGITAPSLAPLWKSLNSPSADIHCESKKRHFHFRDNFGKQAKFNHSVTDEIKNELRRKLE